ENQWCFFDVEVTDDNRSELVSECSEEDKELIQLPTFQSPYLANCSSQGVIKFSSDIRNVFESYILSRGVLTGLVFKCGGSLLYSDEIAHIVVVCCRDDPIVDLFPDLPPNSP
ncbi:hypothetical protein, partial [Salmonella sp. s51228]|uniref:hypothetical protein n=1 Tax=Salmonella sp. s51228 TaxID=3159652 RepID=UPI00397F7146